ncbi:MAG TPA: energy transducer TonB [Terriglobales bacterium]|jgi:protein TonB|nr:energy transducer TonB [Terriglobales bacterium]
MFEDSLIESGNKLKTKRGLTTTFTFFLEIILVGVMVLIPLLFTEALPKAQLLTGLVAPPPPPPPPPPPAAVVKVVKIQTNMINDQLRTPTKIPKKIEIIKEEEAPPQMAGVVGGVPGGIPGGTMNGVIGGIASSAAIVPKIATPTRVRVSQGVTQGLLINHPQPAYPPLAKQARISGQVVLQAEISKDGSIQKLQVLSGHPMLVPSAVEAVKRWKYKPYILNGEPVEVETTITVNFTLAG